MSLVRPGVRKGDVTVPSSERWSKPSGAITEQSAAAVLAVANPSRATSDATARPLVDPSIANIGLRPPRCIQPEMGSTLAGIGDTAEPRAPGILQWPAMKDRRRLRVFRYRKSNDC